MDSGWIKALELPARITGGVFLASILVLLADGSEYLILDEIRPWARSLVSIVAIVTGCLFLASLVPLLWDAAKPLKIRLRASANARRFKSEFIADIPYLTEKERVILGYLRHYQLKRFTGVQDGGHARTLLSKGYVRCIAVPGQPVSIVDVPFEVAAPIWEVLEERVEQFPHKPEYSSRPPRIETHPWRERTGF